MTAVLLVVLLAVEVVLVGAQNVGQICVPTDICSAVLKEECDGSVCVCQSGYEVNIAGTQCWAVDCGTLAKPTNGNNVIYSPSTVYQSVAVFTCVVGYQVSGTATRTCQADKTWSGTQPTCVKKDCGDLNVPTEGSIDNTATTYGEVVTFTCDVGYVVGGTAILTCTSTGVWSDTAPACTVVDCGTPTQPTNGGLELPGTTYGQVATFSCGDDYNLVGSITRTCQASGLWSNSNPTCVVKECGSLGSVTDGTISYSSGTQAWSTATITCKTGYQLLGTGTLICLQTEAWSNSLPTCAIRDCGDAGQPAYGTVSYSSGTTYDSTASFTCNTGYDMSGSSQLYCLATGVWDGTAPVCNVTDCGTLNAPTNGELTYSTGTQAYGTTSTFTCNTGYTLTGSSTSTCMADGTWSDTEPFCTIKDCGTLAKPTNGNNVIYSPSTEYQSWAVFTCVVGYQVSGTASRRCQADNTWSGTQPTCVKKDCGALTVPTKGSIDNTATTYGEVVTFACDVGYVVDGTATLTCKSTGAWSDTAPACTIVDCGTLTQPTNGGLELPGTTYGQVATFSCGAEYNLVWSITRICQASGLWSKSNPTCVVKEPNQTTDVNGTLYEQKNSDDVSTTIETVVGVAIGIFILGSVFGLLLTLTFQWIRKSAITSENEQELAERLRNTTPITLDSGAYQNATNAAIPVNVDIRQQINHGQHFEMRTPTTSDIGHGYENLHRDNSSGGQIDPGANYYSSLEQTGTDDYEVM